MEISRIYKEELTSPQKREMLAYIMEIKRVGYTQANNICNGRGKLLPAEEKKVMNFLKEKKLC